ncbi:30S ribosome-binding factor RbfA [Aliiroseovarius subalbicans]|uniref:30S ribosome-binding factor RbfA n=1 Tax=Aliiroseovarius subalbicans TaxID=2925840 RepID=UPI001F595C84|nr:30S ribosome-binding factor RbfA [Aliiroseovarius subalbicans]MCI2399847.1 30S ribosome-binding factor RbfA [Aliiroseovarius subalbicans]
MAKNRFNEHAGPSQRQLRVGELIRRTLSEVLMRGDIHDPDLNRMSITVSEARITSDMRIATIYVLPLGGKNTDEAIQLLARNAYELRRILGKVAKLKHTPELRFMPDETFDRMDETSRLLGQDAVQRDLARGDEED